MPGVTKFVASLPRDANMNLDNWTYPNWICLWARRYHTAFLVDLRTCIAGPPAFGATSSPSWRCVVLHPAAASGLEPELLPWPNLPMGDCPLPVSVQSGDRLSIYDLSLNQHDPVQTLELDPNLTVDACPDAWWVVSQPIGTRPNRPIFGSATLIEPSRLRPSGSEIADATGSLPHRLVEIAAHDHGHTWLDADYWIVPVARERVGAAVLAERSMVDCGVDVQVELVEDEEGILRPNLLIACPDNLPLEQVARDLRIVHWRRNAAALGLLDTMLLRIDWPRTEGNGPARSPIRIDLEHQVMYGDVLYLLNCQRTWRVRNAISSPQADLYGVLLVRREDAMEPASSDTRLAQSQILEQLTVCWARHERAGAEMMRQHLADQIWRLGQSTTYLLDPRLRSAARADLDRGLRQADVRLDRLLYAAACPYRMTEEAKAQRLTSPAPCPGRDASDVAGLLWRVLAGPSDAVLPPQLTSASKLLWPPLLDPATRSEAMLIARS